jgi:RNA polymerase sigma-70 factor (ECF subfamily)
MDVATFEDILRGQRNRVFSYACYVLSDREDAEDVTQEAFVRLWERCPVAGGDGALAWLRRTVRNLCIDVQRRRGRWDRRQVDIDDASPLDLARRGRRADLDPELRLVRGERQRALLQALAELPEATSELLWLHYFEGLKYREIAEVVDGHPTTVKVQVHRARRELRKMLDERLPGHGPGARAATERGSEQEAGS